MYSTVHVRLRVQLFGVRGQFRQKFPERCYGGFLPFYSVYTHHVRDPDDSSHVDLDSCFLKCVDKLKGCQDIYLQKHYCTHPSNMTHPYIMTLACAVMVLSNYLVFAYTILLFMAIVNMQCYRTVF
jgi:hypothetical protein